MSEGKTLRTDPIPRDLAQLVEVEKLDKQRKLITRKLGPKDVRVWAESDTHVVLVDVDGNRHTARKPAAPRQRRAAESPAADKTGAS